MPDSNVKIQADDKELDPNANADLGDGTAMLNEISKSLPLAKSLGDFRLKPV
jgi:ubiquitin-activating enzyme E1